MLGSIDAMHSHNLLRAQVGRRHGILLLLLACGGGDNKGPTTSFLANPNTLNGLVGAKLQP